MTRWAKDVSPENAWQVYPRPQMTRPEWRNLNGVWDYWITGLEENSHREAGGQILVPFPIESALSGVKRLLSPDEMLWYWREFSISKAWIGKRVLLHFEAVDWETKVFINHQFVGEHVGGYLPFWFDISDYLAEGDVQNELVVQVWDPTDTQWQQRGKQVLEPKSIWYTAISGIWQTVWLEPVSQTHIDVLKITPDVDAGTIRVKANLVGAEKDRCLLLARVFDSSALVGQGETTNPAEEIAIRIPNPKLWSPDSPHLYDLEVVAGEDQVSSYFGMRKFSVEDGRLCINGTPLFQLGPLDQGYWPDGLYTPPTDEAMRRDIELVKSLGFNMLRKHVKVEPRRYYYYCDRVGLIVWQDMPNGGDPVDEVTSSLVILFGSRHRDKDYRYAGRIEEASRADFRHELQELVDHLHNFACIGMWVPFNEGWGQFDAKAIAAWLKDYDPTRPVDHASGWFDQGGGDCKSRHVYKLRLPLIKSKHKRTAVLSEFGGYYLKVDGHLWNAENDFGYKKLTSSQALTDAYLDLLNTQLKPCIDAGLSAAIYTQTTDVEIEVNGFVTYDREVEKMDFTRIRPVHQELIKGSCS